MSLYLFQCLQVQGGCERWAFNFGIDEMALSAEMGLYFDFKVTPDGVPYDCPGFDLFTSENWLKSYKMGSQNRKYYVHSSMPTKENPEVEDYVKADPECPLNKMEVGGSDPLHEIFEEYAKDQDKWISDFIPTFEKMLANGYG